MTELKRAEGSELSLKTARDLQRAGRLDACEVVLDQLIARGDTGSELFHFKGLMAAIRGDNTAAERWTAKAIELEPEHVEALRLNGMIQRRLNRPAAALGRYAAMLKVAPDHAEGRLNRANLLNDLQRWPEALADADRALELNPGLAGAANARGIALLGQGFASKAESSFEAAIQLEPRYAEALVNLGNARAALGKTREALEAYDSAIAVSPDLVTGWNGRGNMLVAQQRWVDAAEAYDRAVAIRRNYPGLLGQRLYARAKVCDWRDYDGTRAEVLDGVRAGRLESPPFALLALSEGPREERACAEAYVRQFVGSARLASPSLAPAERIRIGYFSADLHHHATAHLMAEVFELHDRSRFEVTAFSFGPQVEDAMRQRLAPAFERFFNVAGMDDLTVVELSRGLGIDVAIDLKGFTLGARTGIFLQRAAPVQVNYLGYPGTMGAAFMDYLIADPVLIPAAAREAYAEKIAYLPNCYQPNDRKRPSPSPATTRADHGLPAEGVVFGSFNSTYKITPDVFAIWMRLLAQVEGSVLWLYREHATAAENLRRTAAAAGVDPARLVFAEPRPTVAHLERLRHMDLFLDTSPYNAHTTGSDALWMETPMVTMLGPTFAGRVGASLVTGVNLPELATTSWAEYEALALALARDPARRAQLRRRLAENKLEKPLFDAPRFTRDLEGLYEAMHARRVAGLSPDHILPAA